MQINNASTNGAFLETKTEQAVLKTPEVKNETSQQESEKPSKNELLELVDELNKSPILNTKLKFGFDQEGEVFYVNVIDSETNTILRRYPDDQAVSFAKKLDELLGILFDKNG